MATPFCVFKTLTGFGFQLTKVLPHFRELTAIAEQTSHKRDFESVAKQRFQNLSWFGFERK
jgi:hypothetical protein